MFDTLVVIFQFLILLVQILRKHSEIGPFCLCFALYTNIQFNSIQKYIIETFQLLYTRHINQYLAF